MYVRAHAHSLIHVFSLESRVDWRTRETAQNPLWKIDKAVTHGYYVHDILYDMSLPSWHLTVKLESRSSVLRSFLGFGDSIRPYHFFRENWNLREWHSESPESMLLVCHTRSTQSIAKHAWRWRHFESSLEKLWWQTTITNNMKYYTFCSLLKSVVRTWVYGKYGWDILLLQWNERLDRMHLGLETTVTRSNNDLSSGTLCWADLRKACLPFCLSYFKLCPSVIALPTVCGKKRGQQNFDRLNFNLFPKLITFERRKKWKEETLLSLHFLLRSLFWNISKYEDD